MEGSPFPRLTVFAQAAEAVREQPQAPAEPDGVGHQHVDGPVHGVLATAVVEDAVHAAHPRVVQVVGPGGAATPRMRPVHEALLEDDGLDDEGLPHVDVEHLRARDVARALLKTRLLAIAERRERRSAWEIAFIFLAAAVTILLVTPPLVQILLALHGVEA